MKFMSIHNQAAHAPRLYCRGSLVLAGWTLGLLLANDYSAHID